MVNRIASPGEAGCSSEPPAHRQSPPGTTRSHACSAGVLVGVVREVIGTSVAALPGSSSSPPHPATVAANAVSNAANRRSRPTPRGCCLSFDDLLTMHEPGQSRREVVMRSTLRPARPPWRRGAPRINTLICAASPSSARALNDVLTLGALLGLSGPPWPFGSCARRHHRVGKRAHRGTEKLEWPPAPPGTHQLETARLVARERLA
jgi:hypothetical protein